MKKREGLSLLCLLLAVLMLGGLLSACKNGDTSVETETEPATDASTEERPDERLKLVNAGQSAYTLVYPASASSLALQAMNRFVNAIEKQTGVKLETVNELRRPEGTEDASATLILFGDTEYAATQAVRKTLAVDQYAIRAVGSQIVIVAATDTLLLSAAADYAADLLKPNLIVEADGSKTLYLQEYTYPSSKAEQAISVNGKKLYELSICYATDLPGYQAIAKQLQALVLEVTGYSLNLYADSERSDGGAEILIGKTNRTLSQSLYTTRTPKLMSYAIEISGNRMQILCGGPYSARECVSEMRFSLFGQETLDLEDGTYMDKQLAADPIAATAGSDVRVMTSNVLAARWGEDYNTEYASTIPPVEQRAEIYASILATYQPDAVGVQETDQKWLDYFPNYLAILKTQYGLDYTWLFQTMDGKPNLTTILYRADRLELVESDCRDYSFWNANRSSYHLRVLGWARLRLKAQPEQEFILLNTHWSHGENNETPEQVDACMNEEIALVNELWKRYSLPIFCTGDFNNRQDSDRILNLRQQTGLRDSMLDAKENGTLVNYIGGCGNVGATRTSDTYIDHILGIGDYEVLKYETVLGNRAIWLSDHAPQYTDIHFTK